MDKNTSNLRNRLAVSAKRIDEINNFLTDPDNRIINRLLEIVGKYGGPEEINRKAKVQRC